MESDLLLKTILELPKEELRKFIAQCISEKKVMERMHIYLLFQNREYEQKSSIPKN